MKKIVLDKEEKCAHCGWNNTKFIDLEDDLGTKKMCPNCYFDYLELHKEKSIPPNPKSKEEELWYNICSNIDEWQKITKKDFIKEYDNVMRGN